MNYLTFENISRSYGDRVLFSDITLHINKGEKVALVAENGTGKSSLLRIITNEEAPEGDKAKVFVHPSIRVGYLRQEPILNPDLSISESIYASDNKALNALRNYEQVMLTRPDDAASIQKALDDVELNKGWDKEAELYEVLSKLKLDNSDLKISQLSGGQKKRLSLAKILLDEPDLLILDEPTNHLDLEMIEWLEEFLGRPQLTLFLITHDRYFLERVCKVIVELSNGKLYKYQGNYSEYLDKKLIRETNEAISFEKGKKLLKTELEWVRRQPKARGTKSKSRVQKFHSLRSELSGHKDKEEMSIPIKPERLGSKIIELRYICKAFDDLVLFKDFHYKFQKKDRVGIVGPNGSGKSTLLDTIAGILPPDQGAVVHGETLKIGYFKQSGLKLPEDKRIIDYIRDIAEYIPLEKGRKMSASQLLEQFLFPPSQQQLYISRLSGGEKRRLYLLSILIQNPNFLILDEPTNDLDIVTLNVLEDYLLDFPGCLLIVSHDRFFMDKIIDHLFVFEGNERLIDFPGSYTDYRNWQDEKLQSDRNKLQSEQKASKATSAPQQLSQSEDREKKKEIKRLEKKIQNLETEKTGILKKFEQQSIPVDEIGEWSAKLDNIKNQIEALEEEWMELVG